MCSSVIVSRMGPAFQAEIAKRQGQTGTGEAPQTVAAAPTVPTLPAVDDPGGRTRRQRGGSTTSLLAQGPTVLGS